MTFDLLARDNASHAFREVGNAAERTGRQVDGASGGFGRMGNAALAAGGALLAGGGLVRGLTSLYQAADESRQIAARTENVIKTMGNAAGISAEQVADLASEIASKTGVDDEAIQSGQNLLLTFGNLRNEAGAGNDIFDRTSEIMVDMSAAMGTDASGSAIQLGKALNDPVAGITALTRVGVSFTDQQKEQIRTMTEAGDTLGAQKIILQELERQFGGAAEAMATPLEKLKVNAGNLTEELGGYLLPVVDNLASSLNDGLLPSADQLGPKLADAAQSVADMVPELLDLAETGLDLATNILPLLSGSLGLLLDAAELLGPALPGVVTGIAAMRIAGTVGDGVNGLARAMGQSEGKLGAFGRGIGAASVALPVLGAAIGTAINAWGEQDRQIDENIATLGAYNAALREGGAAAATAAEQYGGFLVNSGFLDIKDLPGFKQAAEDARAYWEALNPIEQATQKVTQWTNELSYAQETYGVNSEEARTATERLAFWTETQANRQGALDSAIAQATGTTGDYATQLQAARDAADEVEQATNDFKFALDNLTGASVSAIEVESRYQSSLADATGALEGMNGTVLDGAGKLNLQSEAGRATADVLLGVRDSGNDLISTMQAHNATADEVRGAEQRLRDDFIRTAGQMGITGDAANVLADQILGIPDQRITTVTANTGPAASVIEAFKRDLAGGLALTVPQLGLGVPGRAFGGIIPGNSPHKRADNVLVAATAGEFMHDVDAVDYYGVGTMEALNRRQIPREQLRYLAFGGLVSPFPDPIIQPLGVTQGTLNALNAAKAAAAAVMGGGPAGGGAVGGGWQSIAKWVQSRIPQARINSTYRPGDPGYHGKGKAVDFGFGGVPGGNGSPGLALINRTLHDGIGANLAELIYDGIGDDRPDLKNGKPLTYNAATRAEHHNHVHAAVYGEGTNYVPETGYAMVHQGEAIVPASKNQGAPWSEGVVININGTFDLASSSDLRRAALVMEQELVKVQRERR